MYEEGKADQYKQIVENQLGKGKGVQDTDASQTQLLELILSDLQEK